MDSLLLLVQQDYLQGKHRLDDKHDHNQLTKLLQLSALNNLPAGEFGKRMAGWLQQLFKQETFRCSLLEDNSLINDLSFYLTLNHGLVETSL